MIQQIKDYIGAGIRVIPLQADKRPMLGFHWKDEIMTADDFENLAGNYEKIGMACGVVSGGVEVIDCDLKNDPDKSIFNEFMGITEYMCPGLLSRLTVQSTMSGGYHFVYKCETIEGNKKLARNSKNECVLETRGEGGYIVIAPSPGYFLKKGNCFTTIQAISTEERELLFYAARQVDRMPIEELPQIREAKKKGTGLSVFEDYNENGNCAEVIEESWKPVGHHGDNTFYQRPGSKNKWGATYHVGKKVFYVFTSSSAFTPDKGYNNAQVYTLLKCGGDYKRSYQELKALGYGKDWRPDNEGLMGLIEDKPEVDYDQYILGADADDKMIADIRDGLVPEGLSFGYSDLDKYFVYKQSDYVLFIGLPNVGKTTVVCFLLAILCCKYGGRWLIFVSENKTARTKIHLMEFYKQMKLKAMSESDLQDAKQWVKEHFVFLKIDKMYTLRLVLDIAKHELTKYALTGLFIDPYAILAQEKNYNGFEYQSDMQTLINIFKQETNMSVWISIHTISEAARNKDKEGNTVAPRQTDAPFGNQMAGRADEVVTIHRLIKHPERWMNSEIHVHKVKEWETGGKPTPTDEPVILRMLPGGYAFRNELDENPFDSGSYGKLQPNLRFSGDINATIEGNKNEVEEELPF